jgi:hypothetical protein
VNPSRQGRSVAEPYEPNVTITWKLGWLDSVRILDANAATVDALMDSPCLRLISQLEVLRLGRLVMNDDPGAQVELISLNRLRERDAHRNLRKLEIREPLYDQAIPIIRWEELIPELQRLEEIVAEGPLLTAVEIFSGNFPRLRRLDLISDLPRFPLAMLGTNTSLNELETLALGQRGIPQEIEPFLPSDFSMFFRTTGLRNLKSLALELPTFGDEGVRELVDSGFLRRLQHLRLPHCNITDDGTLLLASDPHLSDLRSLDLSYNLLSPIGMDALAQRGFEIPRNQLFAGNFPADDEEGIPF